MRLVIEVDQKNPAALERLRARLVSLFHNLYRGDISVSIKTKGGRTLGGRKG